MLSCSNLSIELHGKPILKDITFSLEKGNMLVIHGDNGSGKSTLLKYLAAILNSQINTIKYDEKDIALCKEFISYLGHKNAIQEDLTVIENLYFAAEIYGRTMLIPSIIHCMQLHNMLDKQVYTLSAGWKRRLAIAILSLTSNPIWILDEPTAHLDNHAIELLSQSLEAHLEQGGIIIMSSTYPITGKKDKVVNLDLSPHQFNNKESSACLHN